MNWAIHDATLRAMANGIEEGVELWYRKGRERGAEEAKEVAVMYINVPMGTNVSYLSA